MWNDSDEGSECEVGQEGLIKVELKNRVHRDVDVIMAAVMGPTSKINQGRNQQHRVVDAFHISGACCSSGAPCRYGGEANLKTAKME